MRKNAFKFTILCLTLLPLFYISNILYNKGGGEVLAQEQKTECSSQIPIGETLDETQDLVQEIISTVEIIIESADKAASAGTELTNLADQCRAENCRTGCREWCQSAGSRDCGRVPANPCCTDSRCTSCPCYQYQCGSEPCGSYACGKDKKGNTIYCTRYCPIYCLRCIDQKGMCEVNPCSGDPCPTNQIKEKIKIIEENYLKIKVAYEGGEFEGEEIEGIKNLIGKSADIFSKLGDSRSRLRACSSPPEDYQKYLSGDDFSTPLLLKCSNAKEVDPALGDCHPNNYFCCE